MQVHKICQLPFQSQPVLQHLLQTWDFQAGQTAFTSLKSQPSKPTFAGVLFMFLVYASCLLKHEAQACLDAKEGVSSGKPASPNTTRNTLRPSDHPNYWRPTACERLLALASHVNAPFEIDKNNPHLGGTCVDRNTECPQGASSPNIWFLLIFRIFPYFQVVANLCWHPKGQDSKTIQNIQILLFPICLLSLYRCEGSLTIRLVLLNEKAKEKHHKSSWTAGYSNETMHPIRLSLFGFACCFLKNVGAHFWWYWKVLARLRKLLDAELWPKCKRSSW